MILNVVLNNIIECTIFNTNNIIQQLKGILHFLQVHIIEKIINIIYHSTKNINIAKVTESIMPDITNTPTNIIIKETITATYPLTNDEYSVYSGQLSISNFPK